MYQMQYFLPKGYPPADGRLDPDASRLGASLKGVDTKGSFVPHSALWLKLNVLLDGTSLEIKKREQLVYINLFCLDIQQSPGVLSVVRTFYDQYNLGIPVQPSIGTWIHSIPIRQEILRDNEIKLCQQLTVSFFWAVYAQSLKRGKSTNQ